MCVCVCAAVCVCVCACVCVQCVCVCRRTDQHRAAGIRRRVVKLQLPSRNDSCTSSCRLSHFNDVFVVPLPWMPLAWIGSDREPPGLSVVTMKGKLQALVYDILSLEKGAGKRCSECEWKVAAGFESWQERPFCADSYYNFGDIRFIPVWLTQPATLRPTCKKSRQPLILPKLGARVAGHYTDVHTATTECGFANKVTWLRRYTAWPVLNKPYVAVCMTSKVRMLSLLDLWVVSLSYFGSNQQPRNTVNEKMKKSSSFFSFFLFCALVISVVHNNFAELCLSHACFCVMYEAR